MPIVLNGTTGITAQAIDVADPLAVADIPSLPASQITSGTVATARLGSGTANSTTFLRGDQTWATVSTTPTTQQVLDATAGLSLGAVGSYALVQTLNVGTSITLGSTYAGSNIRYAGLSLVGSSVPGSTNQNIGTPSGTWRALSAGAGLIGCTAYNVFFLAVRIS
jgi:hypothetical protein